MIVRILDKVDAGPGNGEFYSLAPQAKDRWAGRVIVDEAARTDDQAKQILKDWKKNGVLVESEYASPRFKGTMTGCVRVDRAKVEEMRRNVGSGTASNE
jgi:hypothetical protein